MTPLMPATPAWPPSSAPRLFVDRPLGPGLAIALDGNPAHYLLNVMRLSDGDPVRLFDDRTGEWAAAVADHRKRSVVLRVGARLSERETVPDLWLCVAPIRRARWEWVVEKATELGVARIVPVLTRRGVVDKVKPERLRAITVEAAEQCGRTALPEIADAVPLQALLDGWPAGRQLLHADEAGGTPLAAVARPGPAALLIGPEGGFEDTERSGVRALPDAAAITLGPRILRAETAALAATAVWMAAVGDWGA